MVEFTALIYDGEQQRVVVEIHEDEQAFRRSLDSQFSLYVCTGMFERELKEEYVA